MGRGHLLRLATEGGVPLKAAEAVMAWMLEQASSFARRAAQFPIRGETVRRITAAVEVCCRRIEDR